MASIENLGKGKYRVFICNGFKPDGKVNRTSKTITAKSLKDAEKQAQELEVDFKRGQQIQFTNAPTFNDLVQTWRDLIKSKMEKHTQIADEIYLTNFILPYFGNMKVRDIQSYDITAYLNTLQKDGIRLDGKSGGYSEKTIKYHYSIIQKLLNWAVEWKMIEHSPCSDKISPKVCKHDAKHYEEPDIERLLDSLDKACEETISKFSKRYDQYDPEEAFRRQQVRIFNDLMHKTYVWLALASASRRGEILGLKVEDIDLKDNKITIVRTAHYTSDDGLYFLPYLKNKKPCQVVYMPGTVMDQIHQYLIRRKELIDLMGWEDSGFVFISLENGKHTKSGGPMMPCVISRWFSTFLKKYDLPKITLHEVRHTSISYLIYRDVNIKDVSDRAGHQNTRTTEEFYGHIYDKKRRQVADEYDNLFDGREGKEE